MRQLKMMSMILLVAVSTIWMSACSDSTNENGKGKVSVYLTDGPMESSQVKGVVIAVTKVEINGPDGWTTLEEFDSAKSVDLMDYQNGQSFLLGEESLKAGNYSQIRLMLAGNAADKPSNYLVMQDGSKEALNIPSGRQTGYKAIGNFTISDGGVVGITVDFDVHKSVVKAGASGMYQLKPTLRLMVNEDAARLEGQINNSDSLQNTLMVYAYHQGEYTDSEMEPNDDGVTYAEAIASTKVADDGSFQLDFAEGGTYDLYFVSYDDQGNQIGTVQSKTGVLVESGQSLTTDFTLNLSLFL